ncbi:MAG: SpoIIE family protein phosphatase [Oscillospiraceae bacterium]|nr:SpoIIE family protein phosphatase [Oscillospiraceae bacterium]
MKPNEPKDMPRRTTISHTFLLWLLLIVTAAFLVSMVFTWTHQTAMSRNNAEMLLRTNVSDVRQDVIDASDENLLDLCRRIARDFDEGAATDSSALLEMMDVFDVAEINIIDENGIITSTTFPDFLGYYMGDGEQSAEFLCLLDGSETEYVQSYQPTSHNASLLRKYAGTVLKNGGFVQVGYDGSRFRRDIDRYVINAAKNRHVGQSGCVIIANEEWNIVSDLYGNEGENLYATGIWINRDTMPENEVFRAQVYGQPCSCVYIFSEGYYIVTVLPENEIILQRETSVRTVGMVEILLFLVLFCVIFTLVRRLVVDNLEKVNHSLAKITDGDLDEVVDVRSNAEFSDLSDDINSTVSTLKQYIAAAASRIDEELALAKNIQLSALPSVFPPYPDQTAFSVFAAMDTAKEVGGDFYDFYLLDENRLAFLIADVSGKGIPAAMFMMTAKTVLRDYAERGDPPEEIFDNANGKLCEGNESEMFLTAWMGFLETETGLVRYINAGHSRPVLIRNGTASFVEQKVNLMLAMMEDFPYAEQTLQLLPGDILYLYTDGVTEASKADESRFGNDRLLSILSDDFGTGEAACRSICRAVRESIDAFAEGEPQFDDITQVCLYYAGQAPGKACLPEEDSGKAHRLTGELTVAAEEAGLSPVLDMIDGLLEEASCASKAREQIEMAVEEIFVNIADYAYPEGLGECTVLADIDRDLKTAEITVIDTGKPYDPLAKPDPDLNMDLEQREFGGFGIFMVKEAMDTVEYRREEGKNILTIRKSWMQTEV